MNLYRIRLAVPADVHDMLLLYTPYVQNTCISFEVKPPTQEDFLQRFHARLGKLPWLVAERKDTNEIIGYAYASPFGERAAFAWSTECSVYIAQNLRHTGAGSRLYKALEQLLQAQGYCSLYALISTCTEESAGFHQHLGFTLQGTLPYVGFKLGQFVSLAYYYKPISTQAPSNRPIPLALLPQ